METPSGASHKCRTLLPLRCVEADAHRRARSGPAPSHGSPSAARQGDLGVRLVMSKDRGRILEDDIP
jgi:hypothetical protein